MKGVPSCKEYFVSIAANVKRAKGIVRPTFHLEINPLPMCKYILFLLLLLNTASLIAQTAQPSAKTLAKAATEAEAARIRRPPNGAGWSSNERVSFLNNCMSQITWSHDSSLRYCACVLQKVEARYAQPTDAGNLSHDTITLWAKQCLSGGKAVVWNSAYRKGFLENCEQSFLKTPGRTKTKAASYCGCMLRKIEAAYPNPLDASNMDPEKVRAWAVDCLKQ